MDSDYINIIKKNIQRIKNSSSIVGSEQLRAMFNLFTIVSEDITEQERIVFTTLFSRIAYIGNKYRIKSEDLHYLHLFRRANEKQKYDGPINSYIVLGEYAIKVLLFYVGSESYPVLDSEVDNVFKKEAAEILSFRPIINGLVFEIDEHNKVIDFISEDDGAGRLKVIYDVGDKNEIFTENITSIKRNLDLPLPVNLVDVEVMSDGKLIPQAFVVMPDYLNDVTSVAECFKEYGTETMLSAISKFRSIEPTSIPILIGNVANTFLDELVSDPDVTFKNLIPKIFEYNPLAVSLFTDEDIKEIVSKAKIHFDNIKRAVKIEAPALGFKRDNIYLEPSFFSKDYGLQGRLDLFHHDVLNKKYDIVELKSGSPFRANVYGLSNNHYVQTLLYDLLVKSTFGRGIKPASYILYSKLSTRGLKYAPSAKAQQYESMKVRNELMIIESISAYDQSKYRSILEFIKVENFPQVKGFLQTDIDLFHKTFSGVGKLMQDYFVEFNSFIKREQFLSKTGVHGLDNSNGLAAIWLENSDEKESRFALLKKLEVKHNNTDGEVPTITLMHSAETSDLANFRVGDIAVLYPYHDVPDAVMQNQVFKCGVIERTSDTITLKLRSKQYNHGIFRLFKYWNIEEDKLDSSFSKSYKALYKFICASGRSRELIMGLNMPEGSNNVFVQYNEYLSSQQNLLLKEMINAKDYYLLWGPPGTGKTSVMIKSYVRYVMEYSDQNILLTAYTNRAVDEICEAVISIGQEFSENYIRIGSSTACNPKYRSRILERQIAGSTTRLEVLRKIAPVRIIIGTISSIINKPELFKLKQFHTTVIDEASQILEPNLIGLLPEVQKFIMIGDHKQLPAVVQQSSKDSIVQSELLREIGITDMSMSLFERLYRQCQEKKWDHAYGMLSQQGRMHQELTKFPSQQFYDGQLEVMSNIGRLTAKKWIGENDHANYPLERLVYIESRINEGLNYKTNQDEANIVADLLERHINKVHAKNELSVGIITPYRAQIVLIRNTCEARGIDMANITVDTVERYQGGARDIIIVSFCVNKAKQFRTLVSLSSDGVDRKLNVALTRAKEQLILIGNKKMLSHNDTYASLIKSASIWKPAQGN